MYKRFIEFFRCLRSQRSMSVYSPHYKDPILPKEKQKELINSIGNFNVNLFPTKAASHYESPSVFHGNIKEKFLCYIMRGGKKELARTLLEDCFEIIKRIQLERYNLEKGEGKNRYLIAPEEILCKAIENSRPLVTLVPIKRGGVKYQVPVPVPKKKSYYIGMNWILESAKQKDRKEHLPRKLAWEILDAAANEGKVIKKKLNLHKNCEENRAYAHFRWS